MSRKTGPVLGGDKVRESDPPMVIGTSLPGFATAAYYQGLSQDERQYGEEAEYRQQFYNFIDQLHQQVYDALLNGEETISRGNLYQAYPDNPALQQQVNAFFDTLFPSNGTAIVSDLLANDLFAQAITEYNQASANFDFAAGWDSLASPSLLQQSATDQQQDTGTATGVDVTTDATSGGETNAINQILIDEAKEGIVSDIIDGAEGDVYNVIQRPADTGIQEVDDFIKALFGDFDYRSSRGMWEVLGPWLQENRPQDYLVLGDQILDGSNDAQTTDQDQSGDQVDTSDPVTQDAGSTTTESGAGDADNQSNEVEDPVIGTAGGSTETTEDASSDIDITTLPGGGNTGDDMSQGQEQEQSSGIDENDLFNAILSIFGGSSGGLNQDQAQLLYNVVRDIIGDITVSGGDQTLTGGDQTTTIGDQTLTGGDQTTTIGDTSASVGDTTQTIGDTSLEQSIGDYISTIGDQTAQVGDVTSGDVSLSDVGNVDLGGIEGSTATVGDVTTGDVLSEVNVGDQTTDVTVGDQTTDIEFGDTLVTGGDQTFEVAEGAVTAEGGQGGTAQAEGGSVGDVLTDVITDIVFGDTAGGSVGDFDVDANVGDVLAEVGDVTGGSVGDVTGGSIGDVSTGPATATIGDISTEGTVGDVAGGTATIGDISTQGTVGDVAGGTATIEQGAIQNMPVFTDAVSVSDIISEGAFSDLIGEGAFSDLIGEGALSAQGGTATSTIAPGAVSNVVDTSGIGQAVTSLGDTLGGFGGNVLDFLGNFLGGQQSTQGQVSANNLAGMLADAAAREYAAKAFKDATDAELQFQKDRYDDGIGYQQPFYDQAVTAQEEIMPEYIDAAKRDIEYDDIDPFDVDDPALRFLQDEARRAIENSAAARGRLNTGGTLTDLQDRAANVALARAGDLVGIRDRMNQEARLRDEYDFRKLQDLVNSSQRAADVMSGAGTTYATRGGDILRNQGNFDVMDAEYQSGYYRNLLRDIFGI